MPRYLTPSRIGLLYLVGLYKSRRHFGAHDDINVLEFIAKHTVLTVDHDPKLVDERKSLFSADITAWEPHLKQWQAAGVPGSTAWDVFVTGLWTELDHVDSLHTLVYGLQEKSVPMQGGGAGYVDHSRIDGPPPETDRAAPALKTP